MFGHRSNIELYVEDLRHKILRSEGESDDNYERGNSVEEN